MTTLRKAAQQALEAMDKATRYMSDSDYVKLNQAITALRAALEQEEPPCPYVRHGRDGTHWCALAEQSAQPATITSPRGSLGEPIV